MAKELPYFKFEPAEYITKDISFCSYAAQGLFINLCSHYWQRNCEMTLTQAKRRFKDDSLLSELIDEDIIHIEDDNIIIRFLMSQKDEAISKSKVNSSNGSKGGRPDLDTELTALDGNIIPRNPKKDDHFLYLFRRKSTNTYKIGETKDLFKRRSTIKIPSKDLEIIHFTFIDANNALDIERDFKEVFKANHINGDWFDFEVKDIKAVIAKMDSAKKANKKPLNSESKGIREDKIKEEEIKEENITSIDNDIFLTDSINSSQWLETTAMQSKVSLDTIKLFLNHFNDHLITMEEQKKNAKEYKQHFVHWLKKQDLSQHRRKVIGRTNQI